MVHSPPAAFIHYHADSKVINQIIPDKNQMIKKVTSADQLPFSNEYSMSPKIHHHLHKNPKNIQIKR